MNIAELRHGEGFKFQLLTPIEGSDKTFTRGDDDVRQICKISQPGGAKGLLSD